jgi:hypothetical protein
MREIEEQEEQEDREEIDEEQDQKESYKLHPVLAARPSVEREQANKATGRMKKAVS